MNNKSFITFGVAILGLVVVGILLSGMISRVEKKFAFIVDGVEISECDSLTVGKNSDVCFNAVPHDYLTVTAVGESFRWEVNPAYRDSLQYFKINNDNPNRHNIIDSEEQVISLKLVTSDGEDLRLEFTGADVWRTWKKFSKQHDVLVRHFATFYHFAQGDVSPEEAHNDSLRWLNQMQQHAVRSFFHRVDNNIAMVILDDNTVIRSSSSDSIGYQREGFTTIDGGKHHCCKVQFFDVSDHCYKEPKPEEGYFHIDGVNYVMKATVKLTEWGAGHVMIKSQDGKLSLHYPRPITFIGSVDTLREKSKLSSGLITLKQNNNSFPTKGDLYLPAFSNAINFDLCNLEFNVDSGTVKVRDNNFQTTLVRENTFTFKEMKSSVVPTLAKINLQSGKDVLRCRVGFIGKHFIRSYLYLPLAVLFVLLLLIWLPWSPLLIRDASRRNLYNPKQLEHYPIYLTFLLLVCLCYCACKSLIAMKLSYTFPYFEKMTGIVPASTSLMMLLFFSMCMALNANMAKLKPIGNYINWLVCLLLTFALGFAFFKVMDSNINQEVLDSYFSEEKMTGRFWKWSSPEMFGINDTHRSVVFTLLLMEGLVLIAWIFRTSADELTVMLKRIPLGGKIPSLFAKAKGIVDWENKNRKYGTVLVVIAMLFAAILYVREVSLGGLISFLSSMTFMVIVVTMVVILIVPMTRRALKESLKALFPWHLLLLFFLAALGKGLGNFATAFITLMVIPGLSSALYNAAKEVTVSREEGANARHIVFCKMLFITLAYVLFAMFGDNGYLTNYLGFFMCAICFFLILVRPDMYKNSRDDAEYKNEKIWIKCLIAILTIGIVALPYVCSYLFSTEKVDYSRMTRRITSYADFKRLQNSGYRYCESDAEFMVIMSHYMQRQQKQDPLSNDTHFMHPSVSSGQSPVVLNDLSLPIAFFGSYGIKATTWIYFLLLALLSWLVLCYTFGYLGNNPKLDVCVQWRLLALFMWVGTSIYIYFSYLGWLPFTGRLNPGFGVDAVGEALETAFLLAFMGAVTCIDKRKM